MIFKGSGLKFTFFHKVKEKRVSTKYFQSKENNEIKPKNFLIKGVRIFTSKTKEFLEVNHTRFSKNKEEEI